MFDKKAYRDAVVIPLQKNAAMQSTVAETLRRINDAKDPSSLAEALTLTDLPALFAIVSGMSDAEVAQHLRSLEMFLNKGMPPVLKMLAQLLGVIKSKEAGYASAKFWEGLLSAATQANQQRLTSFGSAVRQQELLAIITPDKLRKAASAHGLPTAISDRELASAVEGQGVHVCPDFDAPKVSLAKAPLKKELHVSFRSIVDVVLLHEKRIRPSDIHTVDELSFSAGDFRRKITLEDVHKSKSAANTKSDDATESAKKTLIAIITQCAGEDDLQQLVLAWFVDLADDLVRKQGLMLIQVLGKLTDRGLADLDARRILYKATDTSSGPSLGDVRKLISQADLLSARRLLTSLTDGKPIADDSPLKAVTLALAAAESQKQKAIASYSDAMKAQDYSQAQQALLDAHNVDREDSEISRLLEQIPPAAPTGLSAAYSMENGTVALSWSGSQASEIRYTVVRSDAGVPVNPRDGLQIATAVTEQEAVDKTPVIAHQVTYAVFAFRQNASYSKPAAKQVTILPPPSGVDTAVSAKDATVFWHTPAEASGVCVDVVMPDGTRKSFPPSAKDRLLIDGLALGQKYTLSLSARYVVKGQLTQSTPIAVDVTPRGTAQAVTDLCVSNVSMPDGRPGLRAEWTEVPGYAVDLWSLPIDNTIPTGTRLSVDKLDDLTGKRIVGSVRGTGAHQSMDFHLITDVRALLPITWDGQYGLTGTPVSAGSAPPPKNLQATRYGSELVVSWHWPHGDYTMDVTWSTRDGRTGQMRIERFAYNREGGVRIPNAEQVTQVSVATVATGSGREYVFTPVTLSIGAARPSMSYVLKLPRGLFGRREGEVEVSSPAFRGSADFVVVLAPGNFMPAHPSDGQEITRISLSFAAGETQHAAFHVPKVKGPYWVRLFPVTEGEFAIDDPPSASMKG